MGIVKRPLLIFFALLVVFLFIGSDLKSALDSPRMNQSDSYDEQVINSGKDLLKKALAWSGPPKVPTSLKELVTELQLVTPVANRTDYDGDGLWDIIETVIGTDFNDTDSDSDTLNDTYEVFNDLDPLSPDSNNDGLADNHEVMNVLSLDVDNDGTPNAWDFDNDDDGISDEVDISPYAKTSIHDAFDININSDGKSLYLTLQLIPDNPIHSRLINQWWDWPYDSEDRMQDVDGSKEDVQVIPLLKFTTDLNLDQSMVAGYGVTVTPDGFYVVLSPMYDFGNIVALEARIYLPESTFMDISLHAELFWRVVGYTDIVAKSLMGGNGMYISSYYNDLAVANVTDAASSCAVQWVDLGDGMVALKKIGGCYLSVSNSGLMYFNGTEIGPRESFILENLTMNQTELRSIETGKYVATGADGVLVANSTDPEVFQLTDLGTYPEPLTLEIYDDNFMISGLSIQESYYANLGLYYSDNFNVTLAAETLLTYDFLRNYTTTLWDIPEVLDGYEISLMYQNQTFVGIDQAYLSLSNDLLPDALDSLPASEELPVITATEIEVKIAELSEIIAGSFIGGNSLSFDLENLNTSVVKSMTCYLYNTTSYRALTVEQIMIKIAGWGYDDSTTRALMALMFKYSTGECIINMRGSQGVVLDIPEASLVIDALLLSKGIFGTFGDDALNFGWSALKHVCKWIKSIIAPAEGVNVDQAAQISRLVSGASQAATTSSKFFKFLKSNAIAILCILIDVGLSIATAFIIADKIGGRLGDEIGATYGVVSSIIGLTTGILLLVLAGAGPAGFALSIIFSLMLLIAELGGGLMSKLVEVLTGLIFGSPHQVSSTMPSSSISDIDFQLSDDRLTVGDRITVFCNVVGNITGCGSDQEYWVGRSYNTPWISIDEPSGSNSETGYSGCTSWTLNMNYLYGIEPGDYWEAREYNCSAWIEPGVAMANFPVAVRLNSEYQIWNIWYHKVLGVFKCTHEDAISDRTSYEYTRLYFDVMPESLDAFVNWRGISPIDHDMDGLSNINETNSDARLYDTDGDVLNDAFEVNNGLNPSSYDTDNDALTDYYEYIYGTNATNNDSDGDGLYDYLEIAGWQISFNYTGNSSLPFETLVTSNPCLIDSDGDGIGDLDEYLSHTNPRTSDTNGDGLCDEVLPLIESHPIIEEVVDISSFMLTSMTTDNQGYLYAISTDGIKRYYTNLTEAPLPPESYFHTLISTTQHEADCIAVDNANGWLYVYHDTGPYPNPYMLYRYSLDGMVQNPGSWTPLDTYVGDLDISADSCIFTAYSKDIRKYSSTGTLLTTWTDDFYSFLEEIVIDDTNGLLYVCDEIDAEPMRYQIVRRSATDGSFLGTIPKTSESSMERIAVDDDGYVYAVVYPNPAESWDEFTLCKFDRNGIEDKGFRLNFTGIAYSLCVDQEKNIYIICRDELGNFTLHKFSQEIGLVEPSLTDDNPDWDDDGLTNQQEVDGWEVTVTFNATCTLTFNVTSDLRLSDTDGDLLNDSLEYTLGSNPKSPDSDADGVSDHEEWLLGLDLTHWDGDGDLLGDGTELSFGSDPTLYDTDFDTLSDLQEFLLNSDPNKIDTDDDGATDAEEYAGGSSPLVADSDSDFAFDGAEYDNGTSPLNPDVDGDGLLDGDEYLFGTSPFSSDSDGDNVSDWLEIQLWLNPLNNDTDNDGVLDGTELEWGSNPWNPDSDWDGLPDGEDPDTYSTWIGPIVLAYDPDEYNNTLYFVQELQEYANVTIVSVEELMESYTQYPYIVLVGRPDSESDTVAGLTYSLLEDTGTVLEEMMEPDSHEIATRCGYWTNPQTIVILSEAYTTDVFTVLQVLRGRNITMLPDSVIIEYQTPIATDMAAYAYTFNVNEIDVLKATDMILSIALGGLALPRLVIHRYNATTSPYLLTSDNGLAEGEVSLDEYMEITLTYTGTAGGTLQSALLQIYYRSSELDFDGDDHIG
ncbi:MAG: hypothetical protein ACFFFC_12665, partial [Candidatus Thorarchaeota archaeon]